MKFSKCRLIIEDDVLVKVENGLFQKKEELTSITIPENITAISEYGCKYSNQILLWWNGKTSTIKVKPGTRVICDGFSENRSINKFDVDLPDGLVSISDYGFVGFTISTQKLILQEGLVQIGSRAFTNCAGFETVVVPTTVKIMGDYVFDSTKTLKRHFCI